MKGYLYNLKYYCIISITQPATEGLKTNQLRLGVCLATAEGAEVEGYGKLLPHCSFDFDVF